MLLVVYITGPRELDNLLSCVFALMEELIVGDFNLRLDRHNESHTITFSRLLTLHGFALHVRRSTHILGGIIDDVTSSGSSLSSQSFWNVSAGLWVI